MRNIRDGFNRDFILAVTDAAYDTNQREERYENLDVFSQIIPINYIFMLEASSNNKNSLILYFVTSKKEYICL